MRNPHVLQLIMDSLRYWVTEMHVDGFRFDLAASLARQFHEVDRLSAFFDLVQQDPIVSQVKLIAEPWDVGPGGYQVGNFPPQWTEWNGKYRDTRPRLLARRAGARREFAARLSGSSDLYESDGRAPYAVDQLRHRARRLHLARPGLVQREAQRGQRRGQQRRRETTTARGTAASRARPTTPRCSRSAPGSSATSSRRCCCPRACRCCCTATSSAAPSRATTTSTARTTSCPGSTGRTSTRLCWPSRRRSTACAQHTRCSGAAASSPATRRTTACPTSPGCARRAPDGCRRLVGRHRRPLAVFLNGDGDHRARRPRRGDRRRLVPAAAQRERAGRRLDAARRAVRRAPGKRSCRPTRSRRSSAEAGPWHRSESWAGARSTSSPARSWSSA